MRELARQGIAILLVTHYISDIIPEIDRLILLRDGQVLADGPKDELLTDKQLEALFGVRVRVGKREDFYHLS
jgi:iron complex transport system ATP-binding protein